MLRRKARLIAALILVITVLGLGAVASPPGSATTPNVTTLTLEGKTYTPKPPPGGTDDYHCTLADPHLTRNEYIVGSQFFPQVKTQEVHHAILFLVQPKFAAEARAADKGGKGWPCFGETALPGTFPTGPSGGNGTPWLSAWAPGVPYIPEPAGTGVAFPKGSLVIMQVHYNLLQGKTPVRVKLQLKTVPASTDLKPLGLDLMPAPPDVPCSAGVTGPLCNRQASLANLAQRTGKGQVGFVNGLEAVCGRDPANPPVGDTTSCTWPIAGGREIVRVAAHMHLLGRGMQIVLNPGTPTARTLLNVTNYDFDKQAPYTMSPTVVTKAGDHIGVTCTYDPRLGQELPELRKLPPHFVTWGDGSSDEMCLALIQSIAAPTTATPSTSSTPVKTKQL